MAMSDLKPAQYRGRFAPSPSGPLHFGSLIAAVGSFLEARHRQGQCLLRVDDLDTPRVVAGAGDRILRSLEAFGFHWDAKLVFQNDRRDTYQQALGRLRALDASYPCGCTRKHLLTQANGSRVYPGHCRDGIAEGRSARSERVRCRDVHIHFHDRIQGDFGQDLEAFSGDFLVLRAGGLHAYHLAVVVDDAAQGITEVVRGADLLSSTPSQIHLQRLLGLPTPGYCHLPVALGADGDKLSKQTGAPALDPQRPLPALFAALQHLGQHPPPELLRASHERLWEWAFENWCMPNKLQ
jgi:glutamyl-Q tRNA(Asp) synthetase